MNSIYQAKRLFVSKLYSVIQVQKNDLDLTPCKLAESTLGYRLLYKINDSQFMDILTKSIVKTLNNVDIEQNDLVIKNYLRPFYRYSKSLRICENKKDVNEYAHYISIFYNTPLFKRDHDNFYKVNELVRRCHKNSDINKQPLTKKQLMLLLSSDNKLVEVDDLFVITTKIIDKVDKFTSDGRIYDYRLAVRKANGKFFDALTNSEIKKFSDDIKVGDIIIENLRPLYRYAKSLRIEENIEDVKVYANFVKEKFNHKDYKENHEKFYEINEVVRACHNKEKQNTIKTSAQAENEKTK